MIGIGVSFRWKPLLHVSLASPERSCKVYKCTSCDRLGRYVPVKVIGDCFMEDPVMLRHCCLPKKFMVNVVQRIIFEKMQEIRRDSRYADVRARRVWQDLLEEIPEMPHISAEELLEIVDEYHAEGYARRRRTIARTTVEKAVENGLTAIVADGVHKLPPDVLGENAQLYTLHATSSSTQSSCFFKVCQLLASFFFYLKDKWYCGPFKSLWQKWDKRDLRTSNIAESYHRVLRVLIPERHASVRRTLTCIRGADVRAMATLRNLERESWTDFELI
ncbi:unnamed protein product [Cylicocyclus nassatus]|uniref:Uncharacterized protein n=1 Tax=Cylicocyclus nassatus TaxID=53992 RepID=A0AA36HC96_CYLNA|nr:unnamed protein product [Cylicocyclus nassatus]